MRLKNFVLFNLTSFLLQWSDYRLDYADYAHNRSQSQTHHPWTNNFVSRRDKTNIAFVALPSIVRKQNGWAPFFTFVCAQHTQFIRFLLFRPRNRSLPSIRNEEVNRQKLVDTRAIFSRSVAEKEKRMKGRVHMHTRKSICHSLLKHYVF